MKRAENIEEQQIKNIEIFFAQLFSLLKKHETSTVVQPILVYTSDGLKGIYQYTENAITMLMEGLQKLGNLLELASSNNHYLDEIDKIDFFISAISNLTLVLNDFHADTDHVLK